MFLQPKNRKYTKEQKCPVKGHQIKIGQHRLTYGSYGLKYIKCVGRSNSYITPAHCEAVRRVIVRKMKRSLRFYIRIFCYKPITQKPTKTRMGKGKGSVSQ